MIKTEETLTLLDGIMSGIHEKLDSGEPDDVKALRARAHTIIMNSEVSYTDMYKIIKTYTRSSQEFNQVMNRIRKTILKRDGE